jgi:hypothetical protein
MNGLFGGLLGIFYLIGKAAQHVARYVLFLLIGSAAWKWDLSTAENKDISNRWNPYKEHRFIREFIGYFITHIFFIVVIAAILYISNFGIAYRPFILLFAFFIPFGTFVFISILRGGLED